MLAAGAFVAAGCGSTAVVGKTGAPPPKETPVEAALSWFAAVNHKDKSQAVADFEPAAADMMNWGNGDTSTWATFSSVHCKPLTQTATTASVYCTFHESQAPSVGNPDTFWTVAFRRHPGGRWLIDNYGQG